jgi:hypothetical protein
MAISIVSWWLGVRTREVSGMLVIVTISVWVLLPWVSSAVKVHQALQLGFMHPSECILYFNKMLSIPLTKFWGDIWYSISLHIPTTSHIVPSFNRFLINIHLIKDVVTFMHISKDALHPVPRVQHVTMWTWISLCHLPSTFPRLSSHTWFSVTAF